MDKIPLLKYFKLIRSVPKLKPFRLQNDLNLVTKLIFSYCNLNFLEFIDQCVSFRKSFDILNFKDLELLSFKNFILIENLFFQLLLVLYLKAIVMLEEFLNKLSSFCIEFTFNLHLMVLCVSKILAVLQSHRKIGFQLKAHFTNNYFHFGLFQQDMIYYFSS